MQSKPSGLCLTHLWVSGFRIETIPAVLQAAGRPGVADTTYCYVGIGYLIYMLECTASKKIFRGTKTETLKYKELTVIYV